ncbi:MAG: ATPase P [Firmicutes bacterium]|nr:ATPase P [Bacillota bacterium]
MITIEIPGRDAPVCIKSICLDYNGTIARDGQFFQSLEEPIRRLAKHADIYILTADTYGNVRQQCGHLPLKIWTFPREGAALCKEAIVKELGEGVFAVGNGFNDIQMFDASEISVAVMEKEGFCGKLAAHADVIVSSPVDALDLLLKPDRLRATLRN